MMAAIFSFSECTEQAARLAAELELRAQAVTVHHFPDGESLVRVDPSLVTALLYRSLDNPNAKVVELLLAAAALRDRGAARVILVAPYLAYMRQDMAFEPGEAVSQQVVGTLLAQHFDGLLTVDPHLHRITSLAEIMPGIEASSISAAPALAESLRDAPADTVLVGPDSESRQWVEAIARPLGLDVLVGTKRRAGDRKVDIAIEGMETLKGRPVVLVDDVVSSGETLVAAARLLYAAGAPRIDALATHCLADSVDLTRLREAGIGRIRATDSVPGPVSSIPIAPLLAEAIRSNGWAES